MNNTYVLHGRCKLHTANIPPTTHNITPPYCTAVPLMARCCRGPPQAYWQGAIAAKPSATYKGRLLLNAFNLRIS
jgi:hypothetical protein